MTIKKENKEMNQQKIEEFIFKSKLPNIYIPKHLPLHSYCFENLSKYGSLPCLINAPTGEIYTYYDVELTARRVASGLDKFGVRQGDVIMLLLPNCPEFVFSFLGASFRGAITTTANPFFTSAEIAKQAKGSNAKLLVTQVCYYDKVKDLDHLKLVFIDSELDSTLENHIHFRDLAQADENEMKEVMLKSIQILKYSTHIFKLQLQSQYINFFY